MGRDMGWQGPSSASRTINRLTVLRVQNLQEPGYRCDGGGLYLRISDTGSKSWLFRFTHAKRAREMGLGPYPAMSLAAARAATQKCRESLVADVDPIEARNAKRATARIAEAELITFKECGEAYVTAHEAAWSNDKHRAQWRATLSRYVYPVIGAKPVKAVDTALAVKILEPIWSKKPETASRVRGRIEVILNWAKVRGYRSGENPAQWRGHLDQLHPAQLDCWRVGDHRHLRRNYSSLSGGKPASPTTAATDFAPSSGRR